MRKPVVFLAHGSPMSALGGDAHAAALLEFGAQHRDARGILMISSHWQVSRPLRVTAWDRMPLLYDFGGFPDELSQIQYPAPGDPGLAARVAGILRAADQDVTFDTVRGLDHGAWVPARLAWPEAKLPVLEMSITAEMSAACDAICPPGSAVANFHNSAPWMKMQLGS